jgi:hypothetical protein
VHQAGIEARILVGEDAGKASRSAASVKIAVYQIVPRSLSERSVLYKQATSLTLMSYK